MYNIYNEKNEKVFGCSRLGAVVEYITEVGVVSVNSGSSPFNNKREITINLVNGEHIILEFGCPTSAHDWIGKHVPGKPVEIVSHGGGSSVYKYK